MLKHKVQISWIKGLCKFLMLSHPAVHIQLFTSSYTTPLLGSDCSSTLQHHVGSAADDSARPSEITLSSSLFSCSLLFKTKDRPLWADCEWQLNLLSLHFLFHTDCSMTHTEVQLQMPECVSGQQTWSNLRLLEHLMLDRMVSFKWCYLKT